MVGRSALRHQERHFKPLQGRIDRQDKNDQCDRAQKRPGDGPQHVPAIGPVDGCCFVQFLVDGLQTCQVEDNRRRDRTPDHHDHQGGQGGSRSSQPAVLGSSKTQPDRFQDRIEWTIGKENGRPGEVNGDPAVTIGSIMNVRKTECRAARLRAMATSRPIRIVAIGTTMQMTALFCIACQNRFGYARILVEEILVVLEPPEAQPGASQTGGTMENLVKTIPAEETEHERVR